MILQRSFEVQNISDIATLEPITQEQLSRFRRNPLIHGPNSSATRLDTSSSTALAMVKSDWNTAVVEILAEEAATLVFSSRCISQYLSGHNLDWRMWFRQRLYGIFLDLQAVGNSKDISLEVSGTLEQCSHQKKGVKSMHPALNKVSLESFICILYQCLP